MKRWYVGEENSHSWALVGTLIVLFLVQLLIMPSAVQAVGTSVWVERMPAGNVNGNWLACASDATGQRLVAGDNGGRLWISADSGATWSKAGTPAGDTIRSWQECASDADGSTLLAGVYGGRLYRSTNFGASWTAAAPGGNTADQNWKAVASDADGSTLIAGVWARRLWLSTNGGVSWSEVRPAGNADETWQAVACDTSGLHIMALVRNGRAYASSDAGATWSELRPAGDLTQPWKACAMDAGGSTLVAAAYPGRLYRSVDGGATWTELRPTGDADRNWQAVAVGADGLHIVAIVDGGSVWTSSDGGTTWSDAQPAGTVAAWQCCALSADGSRLVAGAYQGRLYTGLAVCSLSYAYTAGGVITGTASQIVNHGASGTPVTAVPQAGYHFVSWSDGSTVNPRTDTNVTADISVTAVFAVDTFVVTIEANARIIETSLSPQNVPSGGAATFTITPKMDKDTDQYWYVYSTSRNGACVVPLATASDFFGSRNCGQSQDLVFANITEPATIVVNLFRRGDINGSAGGLVPDGTVDASDASVLIDQWHKRQGMGDGEIPLLVADLDNNARVDVVDLSMMMSLWQGT
ncbi:MAG: InlB B-repeat-containing protein [Candidatus Cryosericum sp.]